MNVDPILYLKHKLSQLESSKMDAISTKTKIYYQKLIIKYRKAIKILNENDNTQGISGDKKDRNKTV